MGRLDEARRRVVQAEGDALAATMGCARLTEASLSRVYGHWKDRGFAILSADRPLRKDLGGQEGGKRTPASQGQWQKALKSKIRSDGYGFIPLDGAWLVKSADPSDTRPTDSEGYVLDPETGKRVSEAELSFLIPSKGDLADLRSRVVEWGRLDRSDPQETVILVNPGGPVEFLNPVTGKAAYPPAARFSPGKVADLYSRLRKRPGTFVFEGWRFVPPPCNFAEANGRKVEGEAWFVGLVRDGG